MSYPFYPAHSSNYTKGRGGRSVKHITIHHMAGTPRTLRHLYANPNRNGSAHYGVFPSKIEQYVREGDTAWTNGNWRSNQESITIENYGDWRGGYKSPGTLKQLEKLLTDLHKRYPKATMTFHQDVSDKPTACPAQLRGYAQAIWKRVTSKPTSPKGGKDVADPSDVRHIYKYGPLRRTADSAGIRHYTGKKTDFIIKDHLKSAEYKQKKAARKKQAELAKQVPALKAEIAKLKKQGGGSSEDKKYSSWWKDLVNKIKGTK